MTDRNKIILTELIESIESLTGHNLPSAHYNEDDDVGHCPYCYGWNMQHEENCAVIKAEAIVKKAKNNTLN